jgi:hypothetical protein
VRLLVFRTQLTCAARAFPQLVQASFLGVGAPEAFVIAIVALLVFGPKGLAEARGLKRCACG